MSLLPAQVKASGKPSESLLAKVSELQKQVVAAKAHLAERALKLGMLREAGTFVRDVLAIEPDHRCGEITEKLKAYSGESFANTYAEALEKNGRTFRREVHSSLASVSDAFHETATEADKSGATELAETLWEQAFSLSSDNKAALKALRKRDYDAIFNYGVLPKEDKKTARKRLARLGGTFLGRRDLKDELEFWSDAWGLRTRHYRLVTNAQHDKVFAFAQAGEDLFDAWEKLVRSNRVKIRNLSRPSTVYLFASQVGYETILRVRGEQPPDSDSVLGFYTPRTKIGYFYDNDEFYAGDLTRLIETFYHEGAHQLFDLRMKGRWRGNQGDQTLSWVEEGICCYIETLTVAAKDNEEFTFGGLIDDDLGNGIDACLEGSLMPAAEFIHIGNDAWDEYGAGYPHAALVSHYMMHAENGKFGPQLFSMLLDERTMGGMKKKSLFDVMRTTPEDFDRKLQAHARTTNTNLKRREYPE